MKKILFAALLMLVGYFAAAQNTTVKISFSNVPSPLLRVWIPNPIISNKPPLPDLGKLDIINNKANFKLDLLQPQFVKLFFKNGNKDEHTLVYVLFLSPGDDLSIVANYSNNKYLIKVNGKGAENNQPEIATIDFTAADKFYGDTLPGRAIAHLNKVYNNAEVTYRKYVVQYNPTNNFRKYWKLNLDYFVPSAYYFFKENNKFGRTNEAYQRNIAKWTKVQDSLFNVVKLDNADALLVYNYTDLLRDFMLREKERLWNLANTNPEKFYTEWYSSDIKTARAEFADDRMNVLREKIINKNFKGATAEYLYYLLLQSAELESYPKNVVEIFGRFKKQYPNSKYMALVAPFAKDVAEKEKRGLSNHMVFAVNNGAGMSTFKEVLDLTKGKTVLVDMWGTWCGPCREEITRNGAAIKSYFKGKGLEYLYVANFDEGNEANWKKLIAYFGLEGTHILANKKLTEDIMKQVKGRGYPTYFIIKKDGTFELSKAGYPMNREVMIKQLEAAL